MDQEKLNLESEFDIDRVSFKNVSKDFEDKFKESYARSLKMMSDSRDRFSNANGTNTLKILENMAHRIEDYDKDDKFEDSYEQLLKEYQPFTET